MGSANKVPRHNSSTRASGTDRSDQTAAHGRFPFFAVRILQGQRSGKYGREPARIGKDRQGPARISKDQQGLKSVPIRFISLIKGWALWGRIMAVLADRIAIALCAIPVQGVTAAHACGPSSVASRVPSVALMVLKAKTFPSVNSPPIATTKDTVTPDARSRAADGCWHGRPLQRGNAERAQSRQAGPAALNCRRLWCGCNSGFGKAGYRFKKFRAVSASANAGYLFASRSQVPCSADNKALALQAPALRNRPRWRPRCGALFDISEQSAAGPVHPKGPERFVQTGTVRWTMAHVPAFALCSSL